MAYRLIKIGLITVSLLFMSSSLISAMMPQNPIPGGSSAAESEEEYDQGWVDWYEDDKIVINDTQYTITPETRVYDKDEKSVNSDYLSVEMEVIFKANDEFQLSYVQERIDPDGDDSGSLSVSEQRFPQSELEDDGEIAPIDTGTSGEIYQEGGVWKN